MNHRHARVPFSLALAVAIATLTGCQSTAPAAQTDIVAPIPFGGGEAQSPQSATFTGQAKLGDQPFSNARVLVVDALSGEEAQVIAPGGANAVAAGGANLQTDADGRFSVELTGITPGRVVRILATKDGQTLATLVSGNGDTLNAMRQVQGFQTNFELSLASTMLTYMADGALKMTQALAPKTAAEALSELFARMRAQMPALTSALGANTERAEQLSRAINPQSGELGDAGVAAIAAQLSQAGLQAWIDLNRETILAVLEAVKTKSNVRLDIVSKLTRLQNVKLPGLGLTVSLDERFLSITNATGKVVRVDVTQYDEIVKAAASPDLRDVFDEALKRLNAPTP